MINEEFKMKNIAVLLSLLMIASCGQKSKDISEVLAPKTDSTLGKSKKSIEYNYVSEMINGFEYRTEKNCTYSEYEKEYSSEDIGDNSPAFSICKTDTIYIEDKPIIIKWKEHEWNKPSQSIKGWDTTYPKDTYFTWWGCIDSIITPEQSLYNPARIGQLPFYQSIKISFREIDSSNTARDLLVISIKDDNGKGWSGISFVQNAKGLFDPAVPSYSKWVDNRMKLIISE